MESNIEQCRTCLVYANEMVSLQADHVVCNKVMSVLELLKTCTSVQIELHDKYPQFVCLNCTKSAEKALEFRIQCENADNSLRSTVETIKEPITEKCDKFKIPGDQEDASNTEYVEINHYEHDLIPKTELQVDDGEINCLDFLENASNNIEGEEIELIEGYSCTTCNLIFPSPQALSRHTSIKHTLNFFQCTHCPVRFISPSLLEKHLKRHNSNLNKETKESRKSKISHEKRKLEYICTICNKKYNYLSNLQTHIRKHIQNGNKSQNLPDELLKKEKSRHRIHPCEYCDKQFATSDELHLHQEKSHVLVESILPDYEDSDHHDQFDSEEEENQDEVNYNCDKCSKTFDCETELSKHIKTVHEIKEITNKACKSGGNSSNKMLYKCKLCEYEDNQLKELKDHLQEEHDVATTEIFQNLLYRCKECSKDCGTIYEFFEHITPDKTKHILNKQSESSRKRPYVCTKEGCGKSFPTPSRRNKHTKSHESQWPKKCRYCDVIVNKMYEYMMHLKDFHDDLKKFICQQCGKKFFTEKNLKSHIGVHSGERNYMCDVCGFSFQAQNNLISHRRIHTGVKPYKCTFCPKAFAQHAGLRSHLLNHTGEKNYQCTVCNKKFLRVSALHSHMKTHTGIKDYMCHLCGARFGASSTRKKHLLTHTGERNHVCDFCGKAFGRKSNLTVHRKIHTGETPHVCEICGKGFIQKHVLRSHKQTHLKQQSTGSNNKKPFAKKKSSIIQELNFKAVSAEELTVLIEIPEEQC